LLLQTASTSPMADHGHSNQAQLTSRRSECHSCLLPTGGHILNKSRRKAAFGSVMRVTLRTCGAHLPIGPRQKV
jgi:hypothetical protein